MGEQRIIWRDRDGATREMVFTGELLLEVTRERKFRRAPYVKGDTPIYLRKWNYAVYQTDDGYIILHSYWREVMSDKWNGSIACYKDIPDLCRDVHELVGRDGSALADIRKMLLLKSLRV